MGLQWPQTVFAPLLTISLPSPFLSPFSLQNPAPYCIQVTMVRHFESSFASFTTTRSWSTCTCTSVQILVVKYVAKLWELGQFPSLFRCRSVIRKLIFFFYSIQTPVATGWMVGCSGGGAKYFAVHVWAVVLDTSGPMAVGMWLVLRPGLLTARKERQDGPGSTSCRLPVRDDGERSSLTHGLSRLGLPKVGLPHCWAFQPQNTTLSKLSLLS